ncbi:hypothetical protein C8J55DRAFT_96026 [Lentinula edodes]|uniref:Uncharacterized protein n=1 Tax=Lentinula lateritia TaxID=40482 RepID=A0A9W9DMS8_9AGAR|nr:hypothetical protein C8J55DRAFT_96026 [Lentinula edodes]
MAGHASGGFNPHLPGFRYNFLAKGLGATMWFFIFYRKMVVNSWDTTRLKVTVKDTRNIINRHNTTVQSKFPFVDLVRLLLDLLDVVRSCHK